MALAQERRFDELEPESVNLPPCFCPGNSPTLNLAFQVGDGWFTARGVRFEVEAYTDAGPSAATRFKETGLRARDRGAQLILFR